MEQQVVLLIGSVDAIRALETRLFPTLVLYVSLQGALVLVLIAAVHALVQRPPGLAAAEPGRPITQHIRRVQLCN